MKNSYAWYLKCLYGEILKDVVARYPDYRRGAERDFSRLQSMVEARGISVFTIDLPALGKAFDKALAHGSLTTTQLPLSRSWKRGHTIPRLFSGMYRRIFNQDGCLKEQPDPQAIFFLRTLLYAAKKFKMDCGISKTAEAVSKFYRVDRDVIAPTLPWDSDDFDAHQSRDLNLWDEIPARKSIPLFEAGGIDEAHSSDCPSHITYGIQLVADITSAELGKFEAKDASFKHGPGAVADQGRWGNKFLFPTWSAKLERAFPIADVGFPNYLRWADAMMDPDVEYGFVAHDHPSVLIAVPKTQKGPRLIAKEPIAYQWCQQGILSFLSKNVRRISIGPAISFNSQEPSRDRALEASETEEHATIDLSDASDRLSCWVVERIFRRNYSLLDAMQSCRTRWIVNTIDKKSPKYHKLRKFSTQGSACTFPVQTYVYTIFAIGTLLAIRNIPISSGSIRKAAQEVQVFGDDIIVPKDVCDPLIAALEHFGFKVNRDKTFLNGRFRESCGMDAYSGNDVTPAYVTQQPQQARPESVIASVELAKNFFKKSLFRASEFIEKTTCSVDSKLNLLMRAPVDSGAFAWPVSKGYDMPLRKKWDADVQRWLYWTVVPKAR
nr:MAG: putative replicase protein [Leviviridae sp.]